MINPLKLIIPALLFPLLLSSQSKSFLARIDTAPRAENPYILQYSQDDFFEEGFQDRIFDVFEPDSQLISAVIFFTINKYRQDKSLPLYKYSPQLEAIASSYVDYKSRNRLKQNRSNYENMARDFPNVARYFDFKGKLLNFNTAVVNAVNYSKNRDFYYDRKDATPGLKLYYLEGVKDPSVDDPIAYYTYGEFAEMLLRQLRNNEGIRNPKAKAYEFIGCFAAVDPKTLNRKKIPQAKVMVVYGGYRMKNIETNNNENK